MMIAEKVRVEGAWGARMRIETLLPSNFFFTES
jgi:hypothetical protein